MNTTNAKTTSFIHWFENDEDDLEGTASIDLGSEGKPSSDFTSIRLPLISVTQAFPNLSQMKPITSIDDASSLSTRGGPLSVI